MKNLVQTFLAGVAGALTVGMLIAAAGPLALHDDGIQFPDGSVQTTAPFGPDDAANSSVSLYCQFSGGLLDFEEVFVCDDPVLPGKILVVEHLSARVILDIPGGSTCDAHAILLSNHPLGDFEHLQFLTLVPEVITDGTWHDLRTSTPMSVYFDEGESPSLLVERTCFDESWDVEILLSGYLVDKRPL